MVDSAPEQRGTRPVVPLLNIANVLTVVRLVLIPFFLLALFAEGGHQTIWRLIAFALFALASSTDRLDGYLARRYHLITDFGKIADPIADKALIGAALIGLCVLGDLAWWVTIVIAVREIGITLLRLWVIRYGVIAASPGGKAKTLAQIIAIGLYLLPLPAAFDWFRVITMGVALILTIVTGVDYVIRAIRLRVTGKEARQA